MWRSYPIIYILYPTSMISILFYSLFIYTYYSMQFYFFFSVSVLKIPFRLLHLSKYFHLAKARWRQMQLSVICGYTYRSPCLRGKIHRFWIRRLQVRILIWDFFNKKKIRVQNGMSERAPMWFRNRHFSFIFFK